MWLWDDEELLQDTEHELGLERKWIVSQKYHIYSSSWLVSGVVWELKTWSLKLLTRNQSLSMSFCLASSCKRLLTDHTTCGCNAMSMIALPAGSYFLVRLNSPPSSLPTLRQGAFVTDDCLHSSFSCVPCGQTISDRKPEFSLHQDQKVRRYFIHSWAISRLAAKLRSLTATLISMHKFHSTHLFVVLDKQQHALVSLICLCNLKIGSTDRCLCEVTPPFRAWMPTIRLV